MDKAQSAIKKVRASENDIFASHFEPLLNPVDSFKPDQFSHSCPITNKGDKPFFASSTDMLESGNTSTELNISLRIVPYLTNPKNSTAVQLTVRIVVQQIPNGLNAEFRTQ